MSVVSVDGSEKKGSANSKSLAGESLISAGVVDSGHGIRANGMLPARADQSNSDSVFGVVALGVLCVAFVGILIAISVDVPKESTTRQTKPNANTLDQDERKNSDPDISVPVPDYESENDGALQLPPPVDTLKKPLDSSSLNSQRPETEDEKNQRLGPIRAANKLYKEGKYAEAIAAYQEMIRRNPNDANAKYNLARLLATCRESSYRDGTRALDLAMETLHQSRSKSFDWKVMSVISAAYAETGNYESAVYWLGIAEATDSSRQAMYSQMK
ncbi:MAG: tetratricopeptide repeat protein, partial [Planctomyces sp.]